MLEYATLLGPGAGRDRRGSGSVACVRVVCTATTQGVIRVHHSPVHESRIVLGDGRSERTLFMAPPLEIRVEVDTGVSPRSWAGVKLDAQ